MMKIISPPKIRLYGLHNLDLIPKIDRLSNDDKWALKVVAHVLPFQVNNYVIDELIDWDNIPYDPMYQLTFLQQNMLPPDLFTQMSETIRRGASFEEKQAVANYIRMQLNPHPDGQLTINVPIFDEEPLQGIQHKYRETCLIFPSHGQTCHSYCTFCFRWPQFTNVSGLKISTEESKRFQTYLKQHKSITDVLFTGGDPMVMSAQHLATYIEPLLEPEFEHIQSIRVGTKSIAYWPYRFISDPDSDDILRLFEKITKSGKHLALMAHYNHWKELSTNSSQFAIQRVRSTGAVIRTQSPILRHINDCPTVWSRLWQEQVKHGCIPYYMFIERNTGASNYFSVPLYQAWSIYRDAYKQVSGLARTIRGPSMSTFNGKVSIEGISSIMGHNVFILSYLQAREPDWCKRPFFAKYNLDAKWFTDLEPAFAEDQFFLEEFSLKSK
jgi:KamA family protein